MANPNIVNVSTITGRSEGSALGTSSSDIVTNSASSGQIYKVNSILIANVDGTNSADATVKFYNADNTTSYSIVSTITIPADASLEVLGKNTQIYLEEGDKITGLASASGDLEIIVSYEVIS
tara:strand:+ start:801 stop:1166 length:366 start_codon:yes stop_codon:yes gene_type:complete